MRCALGVGMLCGLFVVSCGGGALSLTEYSEEVAALITRLDSRLDAHASELADAPPDLEATQAYFEDRVNGYHELVDGIAAITPPDEVSWLHGELQRLMADLLAAEEARATFAATLVSVDQLDLAWEGPEAQAIRVAELEAIELCRVAQQQIDATQDREQLEDVPWVPPQMREVVLVSFGCPQ